jgi:hypothetical protein
MLARTILARVSALTLVTSSLVVGLGPAAVSGAASHGVPYELYAGNGVEVVTAYNPATGCAGVFMSTDSTKWTNVTPPKPGKVEGQCLYAWVDAAFVSGTNGWVEARNGGGVNTVLEETTDGGKTWTIEPGGSTGSNAGNELIGFESANDGWRQQIATGSNKMYILQHTKNAGTSWSNIAHKARNGCALTPMVFSTNSIGFEGAQLSGPSVNDNTITPFVWRTLDGGATWSKFSPVAAPASAKQGRLLYGAPSFYGADGYLPIVIALPHSTNEKIEFLTSHDFGKTWTPVGNTLLKGSLTFSPSDNGCVEASTIGGPLVSVGVAYGTWWILRPGTKGSSALVRIARGTLGETVVTATKGLPSTMHGATLQPANALHALITIGNPNQPSALYETSDGGTNWSLVTNATVKG